MRAFRFLSISLLVVAALAGCTGGDNEETPTPTETVDVTPTPTEMVTPTPTVAATPTPTPTGEPPLDSSTYALSVAGMPGQAKPGAKFNFTLFVNGSVTRASTHIGGHFANNDTTNPPAAGRKDCEHTSGSLPGTFLVNCTINDAGTWYVWGHAQVNDSGELRNWWPATPAIVKVRDYNITVSNVPTSIVGSNASFNLTLNITALGGSDNATSDHIGVHWWNATEANPTTANAAGACNHVAGGAVNVYIIECKIPNTGVAPKDFFVRGHLRLGEAGTSLSWWSQEHKVTIGPNLGLPI